MDFIYILFTCDHLLDYHLVVDGGRAEDQEHPPQKPHHPFPQVETSVMDPRSLNGDSRNEGLLCPKERNSQRKELRNPEYCKI